MADLAHKKTDEYIEELRKKIAREFKEAEKDATKKLNDYLERFKDRDKKMQERLKRGEITTKEYREWKVRQITTGTRFQDLRDSIARDYHNAAEIAQKYAKDALPDVYALNHNFATYSVEQEAQVDTSYILYNHDAVERLVRDNPKLLPDPTPGSETARKLAENKDLRWNQQHIQSAITRGIMVGDDMKSIAGRLRSVTNMDYAASMRNARTAVTGAQNAGRNDAYGRAEGMGIELTRVWVATHDSRTRDSHRGMDGEERDGETFSNGLEYPGDPAGEPEEVYNCRCTMVANVKRKPVEEKKQESYASWESKKKEKPYKEAPVVSNARVANIKYLPVKKLNKELTTEQIITKLSGGDITEGSCMSLAFAYAANRNGLDVRDYRGGTSRSFFSKRSNNSQIASLKGVTAFFSFNHNDFNAVHELLSKAENGKEYILVTGRHAAVIKKDGDSSTQFLEMQRKSGNGFKPLNDETLGQRFRARALGHYSYLLDIGTLKGNRDFETLMGFLNTEEGKEKKGAQGDIK